MHKYISLDYNYLEDLHYTVEMFGVCRIFKNVFERSLLYSPVLHLFNHGYNKTV